LNAINGNGLLQQTVLNHQYLATRDLGTDFGAKWNLDGNGTVALTRHASVQRA
jgi:iron complex outermembrane recepter protein